MTAMSTKTDFYVGRGHDAEWLGSLQQDCVPANLLRIPFGRLALTATDEPTYRTAVDDLLVVWEAENFGAAYPRRTGWPWPWCTSHKSDWIITFDPAVGNVFVTIGGGTRWKQLNPRVPQQPEIDDLEPPDIDAWLRDPAAPPSVPLPSMHVSTALP
jgi:hypothetical protein